MVDSHGSYDNVAIEMEAQARKAIAGHASYLKAHYRLAQALEVQGRLHEAIEVTQYLVGTAGVDPSARRSFNKLHLLLMERLATQCEAAVASPMAALPSPTVLNPTVVGTPAAPDTSTEMNAIANGVGNQVSVAPKMASVAQSPVFAGQRRREKEASIMLQILRRKVPLPPFPCASA